MRLRTLLLLVALLCIGATIAIDVTPALQLAYQDASLHVTLETTATLVALVASFLLLGRVQRTRFLDELVLATGLTLLALANFLFSLIPAIFNHASVEDAAWGSLFASAVAGILICSSVLLPRRPVSLSRRGAFRLSLGASAALMLATAAIAAGLRSQLPSPVKTLSIDASGQPHLEGDPLVLGTQLALSGLFGLAAYGFYRRYRETGDELTAWLAGASVLGGAARFNYYLYPSLFSTWVYSGDIFRLAFYLVLLIGAAREIVSYWSSAVEAAHLEERRRVARDLHDGLAQEIAFIARNAKLLLGSSDDPELAPRIVAAAERARLESRQVITALTANAEQPLDWAVSEAAKDVANRYGATLDLRVARGIVLPAASREALVRITSEAVANAANHSGNRHVRVELDRAGRGARLRVVDRGRGFDTNGGRLNGGFGLISMRERAEALGGRFEVHSRPGHGTQVEVVL